MARQRYSKKESINRILRSWKGTAIPSDIPDTLSGEVLSEDEALSDLAELLEGSLPNETLFTPDALSMRYGEIFAHDLATGTSQSLITGTWTQLLGFDMNGLSSDGVTPDQANNQITINKAGVYFVHFGVSFEAPNGTLTTYHFEVALDSVRQGAVSAKKAAGASGAVVGNANAMGLVNATADQDLTIEVLTEDANRVLHTHEIQLNVMKVA